MAKDLNAVLYFVSNVGNDLNRFSQIIAASLFVDDVLVYAAGSDVIRLRGDNVEKSLVMAEVQICFGAIVRDKAFAVFIGIEGARIDVDVGIQFLNGNGIAAALQQFCQRSRNNSLAKRGSNSSRYE